MEDPQNNPEYFKFFLHIAGLCILLIGIKIGYKVAMESWNLYNKPEKINNFSSRIVSHIAQTLGEEIADAGKKDSSLTKFNIKIIHYGTWCVSILLLFCIGIMSLIIVFIGVNMALPLKNETIAKGMINKITHGTVSK